MAKVRKVSPKYTRGLKKSTAAKRKAEIRKRSTGKVSGASKYKPLPGDKKAKTRPSKYTRSAGGLRKAVSESSKTVRSDSPKTKFIRGTSKATGVPVGIIRKVYERGEAAWAIGHRPGATQSQWAKARVYSFLQKGKTAQMGDKQLYAQAKKQQKGSDFKLK